MGDTDRRAARTKKALQRAMLELLNKKDISKITVSELTELADIGRGTFYLHYMDAYDLLDKLEDELLGQITNNAPPVAEYNNSNSLLIHLENIWQYIYENMDSFKVLMNRHNVTRFMNKMKIYCEESILNNNKSNLQNSVEFYGIIYYISGSLGIFQKWIEEGALIPPNKLAQIVRGLIKD